MRAIFVHDNKKISMINESVYSAKTRPYTRQHQSRAGGRGQYGIWAGAATQISSPFSSKRPKTRSDYGQTDGLTDRHGDIKSHVHATKNHITPPKRQAVAYLCHISIAMLHVSFRTKSPSSSPPPAPPPLHSVAAKTFIGDPRL